MLAHPSCFGALSTLKTAIEFAQSVHSNSRPCIDRCFSVMGFQLVLLVMFGVVVAGIVM
jgi:hypothetical protein